jgi:hypothetical protein
MQENILIDTVYPITPDRPSGHPDRLASPDRAVTEPGHRLSFASPDQPFPEHGACKGNRGSEEAFSRSLRGNLCGLTPSDTQ